MNEVEHVQAAPPARIYVGWRIVLALFLCTLALFGVSIYSFIVSDNLPPHFRMF